MGKHKEIFKSAFAGTGGSLSAIAVALLLGMAFAIPGFIIVTRENKKPKSQRSTALLVVGFILMIIGAVLGLGLNAGGIFDGIKNNI